MKIRQDIRSTLIFLILPFLIQQAEAQIIYETFGDSLTESFDGLPKTGTSFTWTDNTTLPGWYASSTSSGGFNPAGISTGSSTAGDLYSFGTSGSSDRALGSLSSSNVGGIYYGVRIVNRTGATIDRYTVRYTGEQWRNSAAAAQSMVFSYGLRATGLTQGTFLDSASKSFSSRIFGGTAGSLNGNLSANRTSYAGLFPGRKWRHGEELWLRWYDPDHAGTDHALAIDDFSFTGESYDGDNDLMGDLWESPNGFDQYLPSDAADDADGDGFTNQEEWWMGSDPRNASSPAVMHVNKNSASAQQTGAPEFPFKTIQAAINSANSSFQVILVEPGIYAERPYLNGKANVHLFSNLGPELTVIDGGSVNSSVVRLYNFTKSSLSGFTIRNAQTSWSGAGVRVEAGGGSVWLSNNIITNNHSTNTDFSGGGGGIYLDAADDSMIFNNVIYGNSARRGGAVLFKSGNVNFYHNTVVDNVASPDGFGGGLSSIQGVLPDVKNNILWGNTGSQGYANLHQTAVSYCLIEGGAPGEENLATDPAFVNPTLKDYHIQSTSPAIGAGYPLPVITDIDSDLRASSVLSSRDIGADQFVQGQSSADTDGDGMPDWWEILYALDPTDLSDASGDPDGDGIQNQYEYILGFNPKNANTGGIADSTKDRDNDGMKDWQEAATGSFQWNAEQQRYVFVKFLDWDLADGDGDIDNDGLANSQEFLNGTNFNDYDSDDDYLPDGWEIQHALVAAYKIEINGIWVFGYEGENGRTGDPDGDGIQNQYEYILDFHPKNANTGGIADSTKDRDNDGMKDWQEAATGSFQWNSQQQKYEFIKILDWELKDETEDFDKDGLANSQEIIYGFNPNNPDENGDGSPDGQDDTDGDGLSNASEQENGTNPRSKDTDNDEVEDPDDAAPSEPLVSWPAVPESGYVMIEIDTPNGSQRGNDLNDNGDVLFADGVWSAGEWESFPIPEPREDVFPMLEGPIDCSVDFEGWSWLFFNNAGDTICEARVHISPNADWTFESYAKQSQGGSALVFGLQDMGNGCLLDNESRHPHNFVYLWPMGIDTDGITYAVLYHDLDINPDEHEETWVSDDRVAVFDADGELKAQLDPGEHRRLLDGGLELGQVSPSGWVGVRHYQVDGEGRWYGHGISMWNPQGQKLTLPAQATDVLSQPHLTDMPGDGIAFTTSPWVIQGTQYTLNQAASKIFVSQQGSGPSARGGPASAGDIAYVPSLSNKGIRLFSGDGTGITHDGKLWRNGRITPLADLSRQYKDYLEDGWQLDPVKGNKYGSYLISGYRYNPSDLHGQYKTLLMLPTEVVSRDKFLAGSFSIPNGWDSLEMEFVGPDGSLGKYGSLLGNGSTKIYDKVEDILADADYAAGGQAATQKVWFVRDPVDARKIDYYTCFDSVGDVHIKLYLNSDPDSIGEITHTLTAAQDFADVINYVDEWVKVTSFDFTGGVITPSLAMRGMSMNASGGGGIHNLTRAALIPFFNVISNVESLGSVAFGLLDGIKEGVGDDYKLLLLIKSGVLGAGGWAIESVEEELNDWINDPLKRAVELKKSADSICQEWVFRPMEQIQPDLSTWEGFKNRSWQAWRKVEGTANKAWVLTQSSWSSIKRGLYDWVNDFADRMMKGAEKAHWSENLLVMDKISGDINEIGRQSSYTFGYTFGYLSEQAVVGLLTGGTIKIGAVMTKGGVRAAGALAARRVLPTVARLQFVKKWAASVAVSIEMKIAVERGLTIAAEAPLSALIKDSVAEVIERGMARVTFERAAFSNAKVLDEVLAALLIKKLILTPGREGQFWYKFALFFEVMGDKATAPASKGWVKAYNRLLKFDGDIFEEDRAGDLLALYRAESSAPGREALRKSLDDFAVNANSAAIHPDLKFLGIENVATTAYRYENSLSFLQGNGWKYSPHNGGGWYCSLDEFADAGIAKGRLQLPVANSARYRVEFETVPIKDKIYVPYGRQDNAEWLEPLARDYPNLGAGGGSQILVKDQEIIVKRVIDLSATPPNNVIYQAP